MTVMAVGIRRTRRRFGTRREELTRETTKTKSKRRACVAESENRGRDDYGEIGVRNGAPRGTEGNLPV